MPLPEAASAQTLERSSQTLARAIDVLEALADGPLDMKALQDRVGLTRSTVHRLARLLVERRMLILEGRRYGLGPRLLSLRQRASERRSVATVALPIIDELAAETHEAVNLGVRDGDEVTYVAQAPSRRRIAVRHRVGDRNLVAATALGRALLMDADLETWARYFPGEARGYEANGCIFHDDDGGDRIRCIASPIRDAAGVIVAALSLSSIPQYMDEARMVALAPRVRLKAEQISVELGYARRA